MLKLAGVYKGYRGTRILENISLEVSDGRSLCVLGPSGCGKSTMLRVMALIAPPDGGSLIIDGKDISKVGSSELSRLRTRLGYSFQEPLLLPYLNVIENLVFVLSEANEQGISGLKAACEDTLARLNLSNRVRYYPHKLSVGERKRVDIARAILRRPSMLILDEPFSNLDPGTGSLVTSLLEDFMATNGVLIYSAVNPSDASNANDVFQMRTA